MIIKVDNQDYRFCKTVYYSRRFLLGINQDGGVKGHAHTPYCESTRITTVCWTIIDRKTLDFTKEDTPRPRTEEKPQ